jgi:hypothetical protein
LAIGILLYRDLDPSDYKIISFILNYLEREKLAGCGEDLSPGNAGGGWGYLFSSPKASHMGEEFFPDNHIKIIKAIMKPAPP